MSIYCIVIQTNVFLDKFCASMRKANLNYAYLNETIQSSHRKNYA